MSGPEPITSAEIAGPRESAPLRAVAAGTLSVVSGLGTAAHAAADSPAPTLADLVPVGLAESLGPLLGALLEHPWSVPATVAAAVGLSLLLAGIGLRSRRLRRDTTRPRAPAATAPPEERAPRAPTSELPAPEAPVPEPPAAAAEPGEMGYLEPLEDEGTFLAVNLDRFRLGRNSDNDFVVRDVSVSRHHAEILRDRRGRYRVIDLESMNGVFVNGKRTRSSALRDGDLLELGDAVLNFTVSAEPPLSNEDSAPTLALEVDRRAPPDPPEADFPEADPPRRAPLFRR